MVLDLLINKKRRQCHDARGQGVQHGDRHGRHTGEQSAHEGQKVDDAHPDRQHSGVGHVHQAKRAEDHQAGDRRGGEVAQHVAGHRLAYVAEDLARPEPTALGASS